MWKYTTYEMVVIVGVGAVYDNLGHKNKCGGKYVTRKEGKK